MQYFLAIDNTYYHRWQAELLIESFKIAGKVDDLVVCVVENNDPQLGTYTKNLKSLKTTFTVNEFKHEGVRVPQCNVAYSLLAAVKQKLVSQPFAFLRPHMLLCKPLEAQEENIVFNLDNVPSAGLLVDQTQSIARERGVSYPDTIPVGETMIFNEVDEDFFERLMTRCLSIAAQMIFPGDATQAAAMLTLYDYLPLYSFNSKRLETTMNEHELANIISYRHGLPPLFHKRMFATGVLQMNSDPCEALLEFNPTPVTNFMHEVVRSYRREE